VSQCLRNWLLVEYTPKTYQVLQRAWYYLSINRVIRPKNAQPVETVHLLVTILLDARE